MKLRILLLTGLTILLSAPALKAEIKVVANHNPNDAARPAFKFKEVPSPSRTDTASKAVFTIVDGERDENGGGLEKLHDGALPTEEDQPAENFFFNAGTEGGRLLVDLGTNTEIKQINTYSWHPNTRGPQVYQLYGSDGKGNDFNPRPRNGTEPEKCGWKRIASVDTRPKSGEGGGQHGVSVSDSEGSIGNYRYLLFVISRTESDDAFGNTFYSEIDVIGPASSSTSDAAPTPGAVETVETGDGAYRFTVDTTETPELTEWARAKVVPMAKEWYPKIVAMLPSEGYEAPKAFSIVFLKNMRGVANTARGTQIRCAANWFSRNLEGEAVGAIFHEMVHVVQQYGRARRENPNATRVPGWLTEGLADYLRWFKYEPQSHGAEITRRNIDRARYDGNYRISANFLNWVSETYDKDLARQLNAAIRTRKYSEELWKQYTGKPLVELGDEWKRTMQARIAAESPGLDGVATGGVSEAQAQTGWKILFNGKDLDGWHNFKSESVRPGWQVTNGVLACVDPHNAGDLCTRDQFDWFELQLDYNISEGGNSGIMFHVTDQGSAAWATGPEFQLEDNAKAADPVRCGWLYALYQPPVDEKTGKPLDATKPAGEWNHVRLLVTPTKCEHEINGVKYFEYVLNSDDFKARVAKSKFGRMPLFARSDKGYIVLQGDHGQVSFRNIKIRPIQP